MATGNSVKSCYSFGQGCKFYPDQKLLVCATNEHVLRNKTAEVLLILLQTPGQVVPAKSFFDIVWQGKFVSENVLKQSVSELRQCLGDSGRKLIVTLSKKGYMFKGEVNLAVSSYQDNSADAQSEPDKSQLALGRSVPNLILWLSRFFSHAKLRTTLSLISVFALCFPTYFAHEKSLYNEAIYAKNQLLEGKLLIHKTMNANEFKRDDKDSDQRLDELKAIAFKQDSDVFFSLGKLSAFRHFAMSVGAYKEALLAVTREENHIENSYGLVSVQYLEALLTKSDILLDLERREEAFRISKEAMALAEQNFSENKQLLANTYLAHSKAILYCLEPLCRREKAMKEGRRLALLAAEFYKSHRQQDRVRYGDSQILLSWYTFTPEKKLEFVERGLSAFQNSLGPGHSKTIGAREEIGRIKAFYYEDWKAAETILTDTKAMRDKTETGESRSLAMSEHYLGELFFMSGQFERAIEALNNAKHKLATSVGKYNNTYLEQTMLKARAHLYLGDLSGCKEELLESHKISASPNISAGVVILRAIEATRMRLNSLEPSKSMAEMAVQEGESPPAKDVYKSPGSVLAHEVITRKFKLSPKEVAGKFIQSIRELNKPSSELNRYFYPADLAFIQGRAQAICEKHSKSFCGRMSSIMAVRLNDSPSFSQRRVL
ncbi:winged helix-turn-helix domain-containing protein [Salinimonas iocasae]|uniref:OmpR/PhoB-type domain-containing protein n=1 Tax=Salinimonas iocasae TaxID=2572577 RepID=A0A5B7YJH9_9ALTE|nr:winged helix-turn-helix domain-containing protein [Salinimonas iocasae]QCZ95450.1 hypothetical protein FBQ74_18120 [Salinimonas iocasae]